MKIEKGTTLKQFWAGLPEGAEERILGLEADGRKGEVVHDVPGVGQVGIWLDACSEGADRGGYVRYAKLYWILGPNDGPVVLEEDPGGDQWLFEGRLGRL